MIITYAISAYLVNHRTQRAIYIHLPCIHRKVASSLRNQCSKTVWGPWIPSFSRQVPPRRACSDIAWAVARCIWSPAQMRPQWRVVEAARRWKFPRGGRWLCDGQGQVNGEKKEDIGELCIMLLTQMMFATEKEECDDDPAWNKWCFFFFSVSKVSDGYWPQNWEWYGMFLLCLTLNDVGHVQCCFHVFRDTSPFNYR